MPTRMRRSPNRRSLTPAGAAPGPNGRKGGADAAGSSQVSHSEDIPVRYWVGIDRTSADDKRTFAEALSPVYFDFSQALEALAAIQQTQPEARIIVETDAGG